MNVDETFYNLMPGGSNVPSPPLAILDCYENRIESAIESFYSEYEALCRLEFC